MIATFELLAEPNRRRIRDSGLVDVRVDAQRRVYRLRPEPLLEVDAWIEPYRRLWDQRLDRLGRHLQRMKDTEGSEID